MIREVFENRHPDGGVPELVTYAECDDCGKDITHDRAYFVGDARDGKECYCDECAVNNGWVKCEVCENIVEQENSEQYSEYEDVDDVPMTICHACLDKLEEDI